MVSLMIVDDEVIAVKGIECDIDKEKLGISEIFTANDINQAKEVLNNHRVDIMLCDIEMPQGSGLDLLAWVREHYPKTECIFLTCHANFDYAKRAIEMGSFDYLLKPIPSDKLENVMFKAIEKINKSSKLEEYSQLGKALLKYQPLLVERFWLDIINHDIPSKEHAIKEAAEERNIIYMNHMKYLPVLIRVQQWNKELSAEDEKLMEFALKKTGEEVLVKGQANGLLIQLSRGALLAIFNVENSESVESDLLKSYCDSYISVCNQYFRCELSCYIGNEVYAHELVKILNRLYEVDKNNVTVKKKAFFLNSYDISSSTISMPDMTVWGVMLNEGTKEKLLAEINSYLQNLVDTAELNASILQQFQQDFLQMIHAALKQKGIQAHQLFSNSYYMDLVTRATRSVTDLIRWINYVVTKAMDYASSVGESQSVVEKVKKFIELHIGEELSREDVANYVYLNPDYLTRIFKRETGLAISEYLQQERLKVARELLCKTYLPVTDIATQVGYKNLAHFSRAFKKYTDMNPVDFRKKYSKE